MIKKNYDELSQKEKQLFVDMYPYRVDSDIFHNDRKGENKFFTERVATNSKDIDIVKREMEENSGIAPLKKSNTLSVGEDSNISFLTTVLGQELSEEEFRANLEILKKIPPLEFIENISAVALYRYKETIKSGHVFDAQQVENNLVKMQKIRHSMIAGDVVNVNFKGSLGELASTIDEKELDEIEVDYEKSNK